MVVTERFLGLQLREEMRQTAVSFVDVLTFEIVMHIDREMISVSPIAAEYSFKCHEFTQCIWTFKDVTLPELM